MKIMDRDGEFLKESGSKGNTNMIDDNKVEKLPEGWRRVRLGEIVIENKKSHFKVEDADNNGYYPFFTSGESVLSHSDYLVDDECLFLSTGGSAYVYYYNGKASYSADTYSIKSKINTKYLYYFLLKKIDHITYRYFIGSGLEHLQKDDFKTTFELLFPESLKEQRKIAEILKTTDNAIERTNAIIEKYKHIKQGLMQDLLTRGIDENGQIRSEGTHRFKDSPLGRIPEEWEVVRLGEVGEIVSGSTPKTNISEYWGGDIIWITPDDLSKTHGLYITNSSRRITYKGLKNSSAKLIPAQSIVISSRAPIGYVKLSLVNFATNQGCKSIAKNDKFNSVFLAYILTTKVSDMLILGSGTTFQEINKSNLEKLKIPLPPLSEQHRIASILSQIDESIEKEEKYKEKLARIKQGLMEDLLTGKVRVNHLIEESENVPKA